MPISIARIAMAAVCGLAITTSASSFSLAQDAGTEAGLPGGASSLTETHGDWIVSCRLQPQEEQFLRLCTLSQQQSNQQGQRQLAIELQPSGDGASGVMILPFGLALAQGITLRVDEGEAIDALPFSTCLPVGCIVPVTLDTAQAAALRQGATLSMTATTFDGGDVVLTIPLAGFASALDRTRELME